MCGIAGVIDFGGNLSAADRELTCRMLDAERHRGPDGEGVYQDAWVSLGHRRLSILDLSPAAGQPMTNETETVWVSYNGEIYNYRELRAELAAAGHSFRSSSDTEVIVHGYEEWGMAALLKRLRGMFAFALADQRMAGARDGVPLVFLARDRVGIKPVYYTRQGDRLMFASEVQALRKSGAIPGTIDTDAMVGFLCLGSVPSPRTCYQDVWCLPAGHFLAADREGVRLERYWDLRYDGSPAEPQALAALMEDTVERHLVADVPVGIFLSGGVDSAVLVAMASLRRRSPLVTLTVTFDEQEFSEGEAARAVAECFHTQHHEVRVRDNEFLQEMPKILAAMDQPTADGVNTYFVSRAARQLGLTVVLSGLGGDEAFFGYPHYRRLASSGIPLSAYIGLPSFLRTAVAESAAWYGRSFGRDRWERFGYLRHRGRHEGFYLLMRGFFPPRQVARLLGVSPSRVDQVLAESLSGTGTEDHGLDPNRFHSIEMKRYLHDQLLRDSDVFSMTHSIELRVPYLDHEILEHACRIPASQKISPKLNKPRLVEAAGHPAIEAAARRKKRGFTFPFPRWMRRHADLLEEQALRGAVLDQKAVRCCWQQFRQGRLHWSRAWATVVAGGAA